MCGKDDDVDRNEKRLILNDHGCFFYVYNAYEKPFGYRSADDADLQ